MKVSYEIPKDLSTKEFAITISNLSAHQMDAVRILLKTIVDYGPALENSREFSLNKIIKGNVDV